jgi:hypothetical protein
MGTYYCAVDIIAKERIYPLSNFTNKLPGLFHPSNPFSNMVVMMNSYGSNFEIVNDGYQEDLYYMHGLKDVTHDVYNRYLNVFPPEKEWHDKQEHLKQFLKTHDNIIGMSASDEIGILKAIDEYFFHFKEGVK